MKGPTIPLDKIEDKVVQESLEVLRDYLRAQTLLENFRHMSATFDAVESKGRLRHGLGYTPQDIILTRLTGDGDITFHFDDFSPTEIVYSTTGACEVRFLVGTYRSG